MNDATKRPLFKVRPPPSLGNKLRRGLWQICYVFFFRSSPTPLHIWRRLVLRAFGATIGERTGIYPTVRIWAPWNIMIADGATVGNDVIIYSVDRIMIGPAAVISQGSHLCTASHDHSSEHFDLISASIKIEANAWVGAEAFIGPGVVVEEGAVVAARAVVVRSVPKRAIVAGNPARVISERSIDGRNVLIGRMK